MNFFLLFIFLIVFSVGIGTAYSQTDSIPTWIKGIAGFWAEDEITDAEFIEALDFLIESGIIKVNDPRVIELENENSELRQKVKLLESEKIESKITDIAPQQELKDSIVDCSILPYAVNLEICPQKFLEYDCSDIYEWRGNNNIQRSLHQRGISCDVEIPQCNNSPCERYMIFDKTSYKIGDTIIINSNLGLDSDVGRLSFFIGSYDKQSCQKNESRNNEGIPRSDKKWHSVEEKHKMYPSEHYGIYNLCENINEDEHFEFKYVISDDFPTNIEGKIIVNGIHVDGDNFNLINSKVVFFVDDN